MTASDSNEHDIPDLVADVTVRVQFPELTLAEFGPPSPVVRSAVEKIVAAGGLHAVNVTAIVENELGCRAVVAAIPTEVQDAMIEWLQTAPRWKIDFVMSRVLARAAGEEVPEDDDAYAAAYDSARRAAVDA